MSDYERWLERKRRLVKAGGIVRDLRGGLLIDQVACLSRQASGYAADWDQAFLQVAAINERQLRECFIYESNRQD